MRLLAKIFLLAAASTAWSASARADEKAIAVVKTAITAAGGEETINKYQAGTMKMKGEMSMMGLDLEFDGKVLYMLPDKFKMTIGTSVMGQKLTIEQMMNGKKMKATVNGMDVPLDAHTRDQLQSSIAEQEMSQLTPLLDAKKFSIKSADDADVEGKKAEVIVINGVAEGSKIKDIKMFFDKTSHMLVKMQKKDTDADGKEVDEESFFEDYKKVQGIMTAYKYSVKHDGKDFMKFTVSDVKYLEKLAAKEFGEVD